MSFTDEVEIIKAQIEVVFSDMTVFASSLVLVITADARSFITVGSCIIRLARAPTASCAIRKHIQCLFDIGRHGVCLYPACVVSYDARMRESAPDRYLS